jgi:hypothetical protein
MSFIRTDRIDIAGRIQPAIAVRDVASVEEALEENSK